MILLAKKDDRKPIYEWVLQQLQFKNKLSEAQLLLLEINHKKDS